MEIDVLGEDEKTALLKDWLDSGASVSKINSLESCLLVQGMGQRWFKVVDAAKILAIYEICPVPVNASKYVKNMRIDFAPDLDIKDEGEAFEDAKKTLEIVIEVLGTIFASLVEGLSKNGDPNSLKIYNDDDDVRMIFYKFAEFLSQEYPEKFSVVFFNKWIQISHKI